MLSVETSAFLLGILRGVGKWKPSNNPAPLGSFLGQKNGPFGDTQNQEIPRNPINLYAYKKLAL
jgi:hypothetical protein